MEVSLEAAVINAAAKWALYLTKESDSLTKDKDKKELLESNYLWAKKLISKHVSDSD